MAAVSLSGGWAGGELPRVQPFIGGGVGYGWYAIELGAGVSLRLR